jgi:hypothetical protein
MWSRSFVNRAATRMMAVGTTQSIRTFHKKADEPQRIFPPAFDLLRPNDAAMDKGYLLRCQYVDQCVILNYLKQVNVFEQKKDADAPQEPGKKRERSFDGLNKVSVYLPTVYISRFIAVLENSLPSCEIASRTSQGTFKPVEGAPNTFELTAKSQKPDGSTLEWSVLLSASESLMLHRFLIQSLHYNSGFGDNL